MKNLFLVLISLFLLCNACSKDEKKNVSLTKDVLLQELEDVLYNGKQPRIISDLKFYDNEGKEIDASKVKFRDNEYIDFSFKTAKYSTNECCTDSILGFHQYDDTKALITVYGVRHYNTWAPENIYFREWDLWYIQPSGSLVSAGLWAHHHWNAYQWQCSSDSLLYYGTSIPPSFLQPGYYRLRTAIGFDYPSGNATCAEDTYDLQFGWDH